MAVPQLGHVFTFGAGFCVPQFAQNLPEFFVPHSVQNHSPACAAAP